jgi:hypothetical protein
VGRDVAADDDRQLPRLHVDPAGSLISYCAHSVIRTQPS